MSLLSRLRSSRPVPVDESPRAATLARPDRDLGQPLLDAVDRGDEERAIAAATQFAETSAGSLVPLLTALQRVIDPVGAVAQSIQDAVRATSPSAGHVAELLPFVTDPSALVRREAVGKLEELGASATEPLLDALDDPDDTVRIRVVQALGPRSTRDLRRARPLIAALADPHLAVRTNAAWSLSRLLVQNITLAGQDDAVAPPPDLVSDAVRWLRVARDEASAAAQESVSAQTAAAEFDECIASIERATA